MGSGKSLESLFQYASAYKFDSFAESFREMRPRFSAQELLDACLMQVQIKLFAADETLLGDLEQVARMEGAPRFHCLKDRWLPDSPNRFVVFPKTPGALQDFMQLLPKAEEELKRRFGAPGAAMAHQIWGEILYFTGSFEESLHLAREADSLDQRQGADAVLSQYVQFRCNLALGLHEEAEQCMLEMIRTAKACPECVGPYEVIRDWANLTTGWSGDTPRFFEDAPRGEMLPVLEDRLEAIRKGISHLSPSEEPFAEFARRSDHEACTMRQYYMDIFHAIFWFQAGDFARAESLFSSVYRISLDSGLVMPFAEYGEQVVPLLRYIGGRGADYSQDWIAAILTLAERYEESLRVYRA